MYYDESNRLVVEEDSESLTPTSPLTLSNDLEGGSRTEAFQAGEETLIDADVHATKDKTAEVLQDGDDRICRICFEGGDYGPQGPLFRPCRCAGSVAWVHMECLDKWRKLSSNPQSFYRCDQCHYNYRFGRAFTSYARFDKFTLVRMLESRAAKFFVSVAILTVLIFFAGFMYKLFTGESWSEVFSVFNINHMVGGSIILGLGSLFSSFTMFIWGGNVPAGPHYFNFRRIEGSREVVAVLVVIGLLIALYWLYNRLEEYATRVTRMAAHIVLDINHQ